MDADFFHEKNWALTQEAFDNLLACLNSNREAAALKYEKIRNKLIMFFEYRGCFCAAECADITINRVAKNISEGKEIYAKEPLSYFLGVAHRVLKEYWDIKPKIPTPLDTLNPASEPSQNPHEMEQKETERLLLDRQIKCLEDCLEELPEGSHELIIDYYYGETDVKIQNRKRLAKEHGIKINALRIKAFRIREKLEACVSTCLGRTSST